MSVDPVSMLHEVDELDKEIKIHSEKVKKYNKRKKELINKVIEYMQQSDMVEVNYGKKTFTIEEKERRTRKKEAERKKEALAVITEHIDGPEIDDIYEKIKESFKGNPRKEFILKSK